MNGELAKVCPSARGELTAYTMDMARMAVQAEGHSTLLLPGAPVTAAHEAGHCVIHAVQDNPPWCVWIKHSAAGQGYTGSTDFAADAPGFHIRPIEEPEAAIRRACSTVAGWCAEAVFEREGLKLGSSLDELTVAGALVRSASIGLNCDADRLWMNTLGATMWAIQQETATVRAIQKRLLQEGRVRGPKLHTLLNGIRKLDMARLVLSGSIPANSDNREAAP